MLGSRLMRSCHVDHLSRAVEASRLQAAIRNETVEHLLNHFPEMLFRMATPFSRPPRGLVPDHPPPVSLRHHRPLIVIVLHCRAPFWNARVMVGKCPGMAG